MINYVRSEAYRMVHKKSIYITTMICLGWIGIFAYYFNNTHLFSRQNNVHTYYEVNSGMELFIVWFFIIIFAATLADKDKQVLKQSVAFGVSRRTMLLTKLGLSLTAFLCLYLFAGLLIIGLASVFLTPSQADLRNFLIINVNLLPILISGFFLAHMLLILGMRQMVTLLCLFFVYGTSKSISHLILLKLFGVDPIKNYFPSHLVALAWNSSTFEPSCWLVGGVWTIIWLFVGLKLFERKDIA